MIANRDRATDEDFEDDNYCEDAVSPALAIPETIHFHFQGEKVFMQGVAWYVQPFRNGLELLAQGKVYEEVDRAVQGEAQVADSKENADQDENIGEGEGDGGGGDDGGGNVDQFEEGGRRRMQM